MSAEYEPLVNTGNDTYSVSSKSRSQSLKKYAYLAIFITVVIVGLVTVSNLLANHDHHRNHVHIHNHVRRQQMEASHPAIVPKKWMEKDSCEDEHAFTMTMSLKEENMDKLDDWVMEVSDPKSPLFHKYWERSKIQETFAPSEDTLMKVKRWLGKHDFGEEEGNLRHRSQTGNLLQLDVTCAQANALLNTHYKWFEHTETGKKHLRVQHGVYSVPKEVAELINWISPTIRFPIRKHMSEPKLTEFTKEDFENSVDISSDVKFEGYNTPPRIYTLYGMSEGVLNDDLLDLVEDTTVMQSIVSFDEEYYEDTDLELAWETTGYAYTNNIEQMFRVPADQSEGYGSEAELDTQYVTATGLGLGTFVFYIDGTNDDYFSGLVEDIIVLDDAPSVVSISYGADEYEWGEDYIIAANQGFGKLALMGITVFASSGDDGALGDDSDCLDDIYYIASFPASGSYVTAVGGTLAGNQETLLSEGTTNEQAWGDSGGGFSIYFDLPMYQYDAVTNYFDSDCGDGCPDSDRYPKDALGLPDISAQSVEYIIAYESAFYTVDGTSCSSPTVAGMFAAINMKRVSEGKETMGFLNPALYYMYSQQGDDYNMFFNDVVQGYNEGCSSDDYVGWYAAEGWDPVTGCGTPKFNDMLMFFSELD